MNRLDSLFTFCLPKSLPPKLVQPPEYILLAPDDKWKCRGCHALFNHPPTSRTWKDENTEGEDVKTKLLPSPIYWEEASKRGGCVSTQSRDISEKKRTSESPLTRECLSVLLPMKKHFTKSKEEIQIFSICRYFFSILCFFFQMLKEVSSPLKAFSSLP